MIFTVIDIETTGTYMHGDAILEVGYIRFDNKTFEIYTSGTLNFYKPEFAVEREPARSVHRLTREYLEQFEADFDDNLVRLYTIAQGAVFVGKRSDIFDIPFIKSFLNRYASCLNDITLSGALDIENICAERYRRYLADKTGVYHPSKKGTLSELMEMMGYTQEGLEKEFSELFDATERCGAHSALFDCYETYLALKYAVENYKTKILL